LSNSNSSYLLSSRKPASSSTPAENGDADEPPSKKKKKNKKEEAPFVCGHVVCKTCMETMVVPTSKCCVCDAEVDESGRIPLGKEGLCQSSA
jgi:nitric oxide synthase-interacting protein